MTKRGKRYKAAFEMLSPDKDYELNEALELLYQMPKTNFDETILLSLNLGIDPKQADQMIRGAFSMPKGIGKELRVLVFCPEDRIAEAKDAGAVEAGADDLCKRVAGGWLDFDVAVSTPDMMGKVGKLGRVLGPQGKMPSPKSGTVTKDIKAAVTEFKAGKLEFRSDDTGNIHVPVGKRSFHPVDVQENVQAFLDHMVSARPPAVKGKYFQKMVLSGAMSPGIPVAVNN